MDVKELITKGDSEEKVVALYCGKCGTVHGLSFRDVAEQCCKPSKCKDCGTETKRHWTICDPCRKKRDQKKEQEKFEKAIKIPLVDYKGEYLFFEGFSNDGFIPVDLVGDELFDMSPDARPLYAWACNAMGIGKVDARDIIECATQDHHEDAWEQLDEEGLQKVLDEWSEKQTMVSYFPDCGRAVLLDTVLKELEENESRD